MLFFLFLPLPGEMIQFDYHIWFSWWCCNLLGACHDWTLKFTVLSGIWLKTHLFFPIIQQTRSHHFWGGSQEILVIKILGEWTNRDIEIHLSGVANMEISRSQRPKKIALNSPYLFFLGWWFETFFIFTPNPWGNGIQFDYMYIYI